MKKENIEEKKLPHVSAEKKLFKLSFVETHRSVLLCVLIVYLFSSLQSV